jgi:multiple sugar transport system permease protein
MWGTGVIMASVLLVILPLLVLYLFTQRYFVESIERTGLIG